MMNRKNLWFGFLASLALVVIGCGDSDNNSGGGSGSGGTAGTGGTPTNMAMVRAAHLAPGVPSEGDTAVDILINGEPSGITLEFGQSSGFAELPPGDYTFGIAAAGTTDSVLDIGPVTLLAGDILNAIAYRDEASDAAVPVAAFAISGVNEAPAGEGTLYVAHGADDALLDPVDVINALPGACPPPILDDFEFGTVQGPLPLPAGTLNIGFSLDSTEECQLDADPLAAPITADVVTIAVAVDTDISAGVTPAVYALLPSTEGDIPTLAPPETGQVRIAHLAPEVPTLVDTNVDILVNGNTAIADLEFEEATGFVELPVGDYTFGIAVAGSTEPVFTFDATLIADQVLTVVAIRTVVDSEGAAPVNVLVFDGNADSLLEGSGRVIAGHGADDSGLAVVDVIATDACPPALIEDFLFATVRGPLDLPASEYNIGIAGVDSCTPAAGPLVAPVTADVTTLLVAVDNNVTDGMLSPAVYALIDDFSGNGIPTLAPPSP
jgi:hypothetical protein